MKFRTKTRKKRFLEDKTEVFNWLRSFPKGNRLRSRAYHNDGIIYHTISFWYDENGKKCGESETVGHYGFFGRWREYK